MPSKTSKGKRTRPRTKEIGDKPRVDGRGQSAASKATRFAPGESGNPTGRPRGARDFRTVLADALRAEGHGPEGEARVRKLAKRAFQKLDVDDVRLLDNLLKIAAVPLEAGEGPLSELPTDELMYCSFDGAFAKWLAQCAAFVGTAQYRGIAFTLLVSELKRHPESAKMMSEAFAPKPEKKARRTK